MSVNKGTSKLFAGLQQGRQNISSRDALKTSSMELKQLLGPKLDRMKRTQNRSLRGKGRPSVLRKGQGLYTETNHHDTMPNQDNKLERVEHKKNTNSFNINRFSHRFLGKSVARCPQPQMSTQSRESDVRREVKGAKCPSVRHNQPSVVSKLPTLTELQVNTLKRRCKNLSSKKGLLSTTVRCDPKKGKASSYYTREVRKGVEELKVNEDYMDSYLTHFMETISSFKMFTCSYLDTKPHRIAQIPKTTKHPLTIVFDMDQTLLHAQLMDWHLRAQDLGWGKVVDIHSEEGTYQVNLKVRPHAIEVLSRLSEKFEVGVLTAGQQHYADRLLDEIDPQGTIFSFRLYRPHCVQMHSRVSYVKDLRVLGGRDLSRVVLVDNSPHSYVFQKKNGVPIVSFYEDINDRQLLRVQQFLWGLQGVQDVRKYLHQHFRLQDYNKLSCMSRIVDELY